MTEALNSQFCVCVPAKNEAQKLPGLIASLVDQSVEGVIPLSICVNNSKDESERVVRDAAQRFANRLSIDVDIVQLSDELAHVGSARRRAMERGASRCAESGILLSTDADARLPRNWLSANLKAFANGASIVGGRLILDPEEPLTESEELCRVNWDGYWDRVREIEDTIDPRPWDPPPRHGDHTGASLALPAELYNRAGGVPLLRSGEDIGLVAAAISAGGHLSHPNDIWVWVSTRRDGRAPGGMAAAMAALRDLAREGKPIMLPALHHWIIRVEWRRRLRCETGSAAVVAEEEGKLPPLPSDMPLTQLSSES